MILTKNFLELVLPAFVLNTTEESTELTYEGHHFDAKLIKDEDNTLTITIKYNKEESLKDDFEKWCQQIDDDIFVEACEKFEELTGKTLKDVDEYKLYNLFELVVKLIIEHKITRLEKFYNGLLENS